MSSARERIAVLGSTGSVGINALEVISSLKDKFQVVALSADSNIKLLSKQAAIFRPKIVCIGSARLSSSIRGLLPGTTRVAFGAAGLEEIASRRDVDLVLFSISGNSCLMPFVRAIEHRKKIALANKEALVSAGSIIMKMARKNNVTIIPIDSEHSAIFQCLEGKRNYLRKIYLTASGGPLLNVPKKRFDNLTRRFVLNHPKWRMGKKISVDSATMMNKGLEVIEASHLFGVSESSVRVLIHPEAVIHSMVELVDGTLFAQLGIPDMRIPIQYAITYPARFKTICKKLDFYKTKTLSFSRPDLGRFPCLELARAAARSGGTYPAALSAADEEAVKIYLEGKLRFSTIAPTIEKVLQRHKNIKSPSLSDILETARWARQEAREICYR